MFIQSPNTWSTTNVELEESRVNRWARRARVAGFPNPLTPITPEKNLFGLIWPRCFSIHLRSRPDLSLLSGTFRCKKCFPRFLSPSALRQEFLSKVGICFTQSVPPAPPNLSSLRILLQEFYCLFASPFLRRLLSGKSQAVFAVRHPTSLIVTLFGAQEDRVMGFVINFSFFSMLSNLEFSTSPLKFGSSSVDFSV